jgi:hypothetical protein
MLRINVTNFFVLEEDLPHAIIAKWEAVAQ